MGENAPHPEADLEEQPDARFWNRMARRYAASAIADEGAYREKLAITREYLTSDAEIVEIGCGTGTTALHHAPHVGGIRGFDISERMIAIAREKAVQASIDNARFEVASVEDTRVPDASADMVMAHSILHLVADRDAAVAAAHRWLRPGGTFVYSTVCLGDAMPWLRPLAPLARLAGLFPPTLRFFTERELTKGIERHGFAIERHLQPKPRAAVFLVARKTP